MGVFLLVLWYATNLNSGRVLDSNLITRGANKNVIKYTSPMVTFHRNPSEGWGGRGARSRSIVERVTECLSFLWQFKIHDQTHPDWEIALKNVIKLK